MKPYLTVFSALFVVFGAFAQGAQTASVSSTVRPMVGQLSATFKDGVITVNDGRTYLVSKIKTTRVTYPRIMMSNPEGVKATIAFDNNNEQYAAEVPFQYEVRDYQHNSAWFTLTIDEGGPSKTWHVKLQSSSGYDIRIE